MRLAYPTSRRPWWRSRAHQYAIATPPAGSPQAVSLQEAKAWLRVDGADDDAIIGRLIRAAQIAVERYTRLTLFTTTFRTTRDGFGQDWELRRGPIQAITRFEYRVGGVLSAVNPASYFLSSDGTFGRPALREGFTWPINADWERDAVEIEFTAGFGASASDIPDDIADAILRHVADSYANRGDCACDAASGLAMSAVAVIQHRRIIDIGG